MRRLFLVLLLAVGVVTLPRAAGGAQSPDLDETRAAIEELEDRIDATQLEANQAGEDYFAAADRAAAIAIEVEQLVVRIDATELEFGELRQRVQDFAVERYISSGFGELDLASYSDLNEQARAEALARFAAQSDVDAIDQYRAVRDDLLLAHESLDLRQADQIEALARAESHLAVVNELLVEMEEDLAEIQARLDALEEEERLRLEEEARQRAAAEAARRAAEEAERLANLALTPVPTATPIPEPTPQPDATAIPDPDGPTPEPEATDPVPEVTPDPEPAPPGPAVPFVCPVAGAHNFIDSWGDPRVSGGWHKGVDMMAAEGVPVVAVESGRVEHRGNAVGGLSSHLYADSGAYYYYTHLSGYAQDGQVAQGTVIAYVGMTGNAPVPHLHFEIHPTGYNNPVNPYPTVAAYC